MRAPTTRPSVLIATTASYRRDAGRRPRLQVLLLQRASGSAARRPDGQRREAPLMTASAGMAPTIMPMMPRDPLPQPAEGSPVFDDHVRWPHRVRQHRAGRSDHPPYRWRADLQLLCLSMTGIWRSPTWCVGRPYQQHPAPDQHLQGTERAGAGVCPRLHDPGATTAPNSPSATARSP